MTVKDHNISRSDLLDLEEELIRGESKKVLNKIQKEHDWKPSKPTFRNDEEAKLTLLSAIALKDMARFDEAFEQTRWVEVYAKEHKDDELLAGCMFNLTSLHRHDGRFDRALDASRECQRLYKDHLNLGRTMSYRAILFYRLGMVELGLEMVDDALELFDGISGSIKKSVQYKVARANLDYIRAFIEFEKCEKSKVKPSDQHLLAAEKLNTDENHKPISRKLDSFLLFERGRFQMKINGENPVLKFQQSLELRNDLGDEKGEAECYIWAGKHFNSKGNGGSAIKYLENARAIAERLGSDELLCEVYRELGHACESEFNKNRDSDKASQAITFKNLYSERRRNLEEHKRGFLDPFIVIPGNEDPEQIKISSELVNYLTTFTDFYQTTLKKKVKGEKHFDKKRATRLLKNSRTGNNEEHFTTELLNATTTLHLYIQEEAGEHHCCAIWEPKKSHDLQTLYKLLHSKKLLEKKSGGMTYDDFEKHFFGKPEVSNYFGKLIWKKKTPSLVYMYRRLLDEKYILFDEFLDAWSRKLESNWTLTSKPHNLLSSFRSASSRWDLLGEKDVKEDHKIDPSHYEKLGDSEIIDEVIEALLTSKTPTKPST